MRGMRSKATTAPMPMQVADARTVLAQVLRTELPALEEAIAARDFDRALLFGAVVRSARQQVRSVLGGGDHGGALRVEWSRVEARLDAALISSPRPTADAETARRQWAQRLARGTGTPAIVEPARRTAAGSKPTPGMAAVANAIGEEIYFAPEGSDTIDTVDEPSGFGLEPPTMPRIKRPRRNTR